MEGSEYPLVRRIANLIGLLILLVVLAIMNATRGAIPGIHIAIAAPAGHQTASPTIGPPPAQTAGP